MLESRLNHFYFDCPDSARDFEWIQLHASVSDSIMTIIYELSRAGDPCLIFNIEALSSPIYSQKMPSGEHRAAQANRLIQIYRAAQKAAKKCLRHCKTQLCRSFQLAKAQGLRRTKSSLEILSDLSDLSPLSSLTEEANSDASDSHDYEWDNILGGNWRSV